MVNGQPDFIVIGGGTAGCVLADRLTADGRHRVTLLEWGGEDRNPWVHIPIGYGKLANHPVLSTRFISEPEPGLEGRRLTIPRGRVLGGCSSTNGLLYIRGQPQDYDDWAAGGNAGWSYRDVLPYFRRAEDYYGGENEVHGIGGPMKVSPPAAPHPLAEAFIESGVAQGLTRRADFNGTEQEGIGYYDVTINGIRRASTATAYLRRARKRRNLTVITGARATRLLFEGLQTTGIEYMHDGELTRISATREIILAAGAIASPHLLLLSGLGSGRVLSGFGIPVVLDLPGVGAHLADHANVRMNYRAKQPITINDRLGSMFGQIGAGLEYLLRGTGPLTVSAGFGAAFYRTQPELDRPDFQGYLLLFQTDASGTRLEPFSSFMTSGYQLRPKSRGAIELASPDPFELPHIRANLLVEEDDQRVTLAGLKRLRAILRAPQMAALAGESEPGDGADDAELLAYIRAKAGTGHHLVGSCRMGHGADAVVDSRLAVRGVGGLRVVDASIMPSIVSGNTCAPVVMIAEKAADMILEDHR